MFVCTCVCLFALLGVLLQSRPVVSDPTSFYISGFEQISPFGMSVEYILQCLPSLFMDALHTSPIELDGRIGRVCVCVWFGASVGMSVCVCVCVSGAVCHDVCVCVCGSGQ